MMEGNSMPLLMSSLFFELEVLKVFEVTYVFPLLSSLSRYRQMQLIIADFDPLPYELIHDFYHNEYQFCPLPHLKRLEKELIKMNFGSVHTQGLPGDARLPDQDGFLLGMVKPLRALKFAQIS
jgi:hypothetical protein